MASIRQLAAKSAAEDGEDIEAAWTQSVEPIISLLRSRFERLKLGDNPVCET